MVNLNRYNAYDLVFFCAYGSLDDPKISAIGNIAEINRVIQEYVRTNKPKYFQDEFQRELTSELEKKAKSKGDDDIFDRDGLPDDISEGEDDELLF